MHSQRECTLGIPSISDTAHAHFAKGASLTLGAHTQRVLGLCVFLSAAITGFEAAHERYQRLQNYANLKIN